VAIIAEKLEAYRPCACRQGGKAACLLACGAVSALPAWLRDQACALA